MIQCIKCKADITFFNKKNFAFYNNKIIFAENNIGEKKYDIYIVLITILTTIKFKIIT